MFKRRRVSMIAATAATLAATALAITAQNDADAAPAAGAHSAARTTLHLQVAGCDRCTVQLQRAVHGDERVWQTRQQRVGSDHVATFEVPLRVTHGMSFVVRAPWAQGTDAVPNAVTAYAGRQVGSAVSATAARRAHRAAGCWQGTQDATKTLRFRVARVTTSSPSGQEVVTPLVYAQHTMRARRPFVKTFHGTIGNQDAFYCASSRG